MEPPIKSPERIQLPPPTLTLRDRNQGIIQNWDDFGAVFAEVYQMNLFDLIQSQEYDKDVEAREQIELTVTDGILPVLLKNASLPKRPANWNVALFDFYQKMQQKIITEIGLEEFLACSVFRIRAVVSSTIYKRKRYSSFHRNPNDNEKENLKFLADNHEVLGFDATKFRRKFYSLLDRGDFFSMEGVLRSMGEKMKGWKTIVDRLQTARGKEMVIFEIRGAVATRLFLGAFNAFHQHYTGSNMIVAEIGLAPCAQIPLRQHLP